MLFNEPKLLKSRAETRCGKPYHRFSALQRAEIAEIQRRQPKTAHRRLRFSALQRAEIAEIYRNPSYRFICFPVSVLFNEPKLLKLAQQTQYVNHDAARFSALQRAEIAEIRRSRPRLGARLSFSALQLQCSSTSRNC